MGSRYKFHLFLSFATEQKNEAQAIVNSIRNAGLGVFWSSDIQPGDDWKESLNRAIAESRHFLLLCSVNAAASDHVNDELVKFQDLAAGDSTRRLFVLPAKGAQPKHVPDKLGTIHQVDSLERVLIAILKEARTELASEYKEFGESAESDKSALNEELAAERRKVNEARQYYRHRRFWGGFAENRDIHIFTCGRDIPPDPKRPRGTGGGRTNIDKWDYRAVLDITHFFALNYPAATLTIEDPASKLQQDDIEKTNVLANRIAEVRSLLEDKDCIIVGSPDVNDFAEIVLSRIHQIDPYDDSRRKSQGFVLVRNEKNSASAFYWRRQDEESEGIARLGPDPQIYRHEEALGAQIGTTYGILVVADNPFKRLHARRIMILSGFSGVATNAMTKFLTEDAYLSSFFEFDEAYSQQERAIEALIAVRYVADPGAEKRDTRQILEGIDSISFRDIQAVP